MAYTTINKPSDYFNTLLYTGTGSQNSVTGVGFQPDFVWGKKRSGIDNHFLQDVVRGSQEVLFSNTTDAEQTGSQTIFSFDSDGFTVGTDSGLNGSGGTYVYWNWLADNTSGSSNTDGSITSTVSANTTSGFSIVKYTGTGSNGTVGHGLGVAPKLIITKSLASAQEWCVGTDDIGWGNYLFLNETSAVQAGSTYWQSTAPTSSYFSVGTAGPTNSSAGDLIAYCFAEKKGFSKFGSYTGNGSADGPFIYTGFKPAFVMIKKTSAIESWYILDNKRPSYNTNNYYLLPNSSGVEGTSTTLATSLLSNGFKIENTDTSMNTSGGSYIYMAFAEHPLVSSSGVPCTAR